MTTGPAMTGGRQDLSGHCRNAHTPGPRDPAGRKYGHPGNYLLNNVHPPNHGQI